MTPGPSRTAPPPPRPGDGGDRTRGLRRVRPLGEVAGAPSTTTPLLSRQELALLSLTAGGLQLDIVARRLDVSERTLRRRMRRVCDRLGVASPIEAVVWAVRRGLI